MCWTRFVPVFLISHFVRSPAVSERSCSSQQKAGTQVEGEALEVRQLFSFLLPLLFFMNQVNSILCLFALLCVPYLSQLVGAPGGYYSVPSQMSFSSPCRRTWQPSRLRHRTRKRMSKMKRTRVTHKENQTEGLAVQTGQVSGKGGGDPIGNNRMSSF